MNESRPDKNIISLGDNVRYLRKLHDILTKPFIGKVINNKFKITFL
jgi:hypothetical protein